jgi:glycosyltransferase involved in cell wall biosynthesis
MAVCGIVPTYNERENIEPLVRSLRSILPDLRLLIVDDNSPDGTAGAVRGLQAEISGLDLLVRPGKLGFGAAYLDGFRRVTADPAIDSILMMDGDLSHDPRAVPELVAALAECDVAIGSRYTPGGRVEGWPLRRRLLSAGGNRYVRAVTGMPIHDCTAGFMLLRAEVARRIAATPMEMTGYAFLMELKHRLWRWGLRIREVPIVFRDRTAGKSKISNGIIREGIVAPWVLRRRAR